MKATANGNGDAENRQNRASLQQGGEGHPCESCRYLLNRRFSCCVMAGASTEGACEAAPLFGALASASRCATVAALEERKLAKVASSMADLGPTKDLQSCGSRVQEEKTSQQHHSSSGKKERKRGRSAIERSNAGQRQRERQRPTGSSDSCTCNQ